MTCRRIRGIIAHMKKIYRMYQLTKLVDELVEKHEKKNPSALKNSNYDVWHPTSAYLKGEFIVKHKRVTLQQANSILASAIKNEYLQGNHQNHNGQKVDIVCINPDKGGDLLDTVPYLPFLKIGLYEEIWKKHGVFISGIVVGVFLPLIIALCKWLVGVIIERYGR